jgi:hypothetical protein
MCSIRRSALERQVADAGAGVDQDVVVQQERRRPAAGRDGAGATEHLDDHGGRCSGRTERGASALATGIAAAGAHGASRRRRVVKCVTPKA